jgi:hypothetical protein
MIIIINYQAFVKGCLESVLRSFVSFQMMYRVIERNDSWPAYIKPKQKIEQ